MRNVNIIRGCFVMVTMLSTGAMQAQRQYWGIAQGSSDVNSPVGIQGIIRTDSLGSGATVVYRFGSPGVGYANPGGGLLQASDGRIYCYTSWNDSAGVVSVDPVTDSVNIVHVYPIPGFQHYGVRPSSTPVEGQDGQLIDATLGIGLFRYGIASQQINVLTTMPPDVGGQYGTIGGTLFKANNGKLYASQDGTLTLGCKLAVIDPLTNTYTRWPVISDVETDGLNFNRGPMIQNGNTIITICEQGGPGFESFGFQGYGVLGAFDLNTEMYQPLHYFDSVVHNPIRGVVRASNGLLYGEAFGDTIVEQGATQGHYGCIYSYDPITNDVTRLHSYGDLGLGWGVTGFSGISGLLAANNGKLYGSFRNGIFEYDPVADTLALRAPLMYTDTNGAMQGYGLQAPLIEICRKPNYKPRPTTSFNVCAGAHFAYDLKNVNATTVVWRRNGVVVPNRTDQRLEFEAIAETDEGVWTCTLTNACGVTQPPPITITVNPGPFTTSTITGDTLLCGSGDVVVLSGNNGGTWNTGATTPTLTLTQTGQYFVYNQHACGLSMSNIITVAHLDSAVVPPTVNTENPFSTSGDVFTCPEFLPYVFTGNVPGPWNIYTPGVWSTGGTGPSLAVQDTGSYYLTVSNACNTDTSNIWHLRYYPEQPPSTLAFTNAQGLPADTYLCSGESVTIAVADPSFSNTYTWLLPDFTNVFGDFSITATEPGNYSLTISGPGFCTPRELPFTIYADELPPENTPIILPDQPTLSGCDQDSVYLFSSQLPCYWTWTDGDGVPQRDTTEIILVDWQASSYSLTAFNGCGEGPQDFITIDGIPSPDVQFNTASDTLCLSGGAITLHEGTPPGGTYSGPGVIGNTFNPAAAGIGEHTITYSYSDGDCTGFAQDVIAVDICQGVVAPAHGGGMVIHPNPTAGRFAMTLGSSGPATVTLHDATGSVVWLRSVNGPGPHALHVSDLAGGNYAVRVEGQGTLAHGRLVLMP